MLTLFKSDSQLFWNQEDTMDIGETYARTVGDAVKRQGMSKAAPTSLKLDLASDGMYVVILSAACSTEQLISECGWC